MARKTPKQLLEDAMPGMKVVSPTTGADAPMAGTRPGPSMADLKKKFLGDAADNTFTEPASAEIPHSKQGSVKVFQVRPKNKPADPVDDPGSRTIIVDDQGLLGGRG